FVTRTVQWTIAAVFGLILSNSLLKSACSHLFNRSGIFHFLPHWADINILLFIIKKLICRKRILFIVGFILLLVEHIRLYKRLHLLLLKQRVILFGSIARIRSKGFRCAFKTGFMLLQV